MPPPSIANKKMNTMTSNCVNKGRSQKKYSPKPSCRAWHPRKAVSQWQKTVHLYWVQALHLASPEQGNPQSSRPSQELRQHCASIKIFPNQNTYIFLSYGHYNRDSPNKRLAHKKNPKDLFSYIGSYKIEKLTKLSQIVSHGNTHIISGPIQQ